jgi:protein SCO1/2
MTIANDMTSEPTAAATAQPAPRPRRQELLTGLLWSVLVVAMIAIVGAGLAQRFRRAQVVELPILFDAPQFALIDQESRPVESGRLRGKPYIATFIFTHCAGVCPMMTQKMAKLQKAVPSSDVRLVTFTVDAERDTPAVLKEYAARFGADAARWFFLTGTQPQMNDVAKGMNVAAMKMADGSDQFIHSEKFLLVDGFGHVRGLYRSNEDESLKKLAADATELAEYEARTGGSHP